MRFSFAKKFVFLIYRLKIICIINIKNELNFIESSKIIQTSYILQFWFQQLLYTVKLRKYRCYFDNHILASSRMEATIRNHLVSTLRDPVKILLRTIRNTVTNKCTEQSVRIVYKNILTAFVVIHAEWPTDRIELTTLNTIGVQPRVHTFTFSYPVVLVHRTSRTSIFIPCLLSRWARQCIVSCKGRKKKKKKNYWAFDVRF